MRFSLVLTVAAMLVFGSIVAFAQQESTGSPDDAFWVAYWAQPRLVLFGPDQADFNQNVQEILFPWNESVSPSNPETLDANAQWLKSHPNAHFCIEGYASSRGELIYNLVLSQERANWVKQQLVSRGVPESQIAMAVGWGQLYPVCPELNDDCWSKNRRVRFSYSPH